MIKRFYRNSKKRDKKLLLGYSKTPFNELRRVRQNARVAKKIFGIKFSKESLQEYYFWDNTTVSLKSPLIEFGLDGMKILEIGTGPSATLSRFIAKSKKNLCITAADINENFLKSGAKYKIEGKGNLISFVVSDISKNIDGKFDLIFMNPPYVSHKDLMTIGIDRNSSEYSAGFGGQDGGAIVEKFLSQIPRLMINSSVALLGVNNKYLSDENVTSLISSSNLTLSRRFYNEHEVPPFSQVYVLKMKC